MTENTVETVSTESETLPLAPIPTPELTPIPVDESGAELDLFFSDEDMAKLQRALAKGPRRGRYGKVTDAHTGQTFMVYGGSKHGPGRVICRLAGGPVDPVQE